MSPNTAVVPVAALPLPQQVQTTWPGKRPPGDPEPGPQAVSGGDRAEVQCVSPTHARERGAGDPPEQVKEHLPGDREAAVACGRPPTLPPRVCGPAAGQRAASGEADQPTEGSVEGARQGLPGERGWGGLCRPALRPNGTAPPLT